VTFWFLLLAFAASLNPCRFRLAFAGRPEVVALGSLAALGVGATLCFLGEAVLDALAISPESFRLAAALVLAVEGIRALLAASPRPAPALAALRAALVPVAFPLLLQPGVVVLALAAGGDDVAATAVGALAIALVPVIGASLLAGGARTDALLLAGGRLFGALEIVAGAALAVDAIRDV
jgi:small neutral amino acid transporter SnatA (MarC family)